MSNVYGKRSGEAVVIDNGRGQPKLEMHNFIDSKDEGISLTIVGPRGGDQAMIRISKDNLRTALLQAGIARRAEPETPTYIDPMASDYPTLAAHEPTPGIKDSRAAAGLDGGDTLELGNFRHCRGQCMPSEERPFTPTITTLPHQVHGCPEGCDCDECAKMQAVFARGDALRATEAF